MFVKLPQRSRTGGKTVILEPSPPYLPLKAISWTSRSTWQFLNYLFELISLRNFTRLKDWTRNQLKGREGNVHVIENQNEIKKS